jgi:oxygen-dependent protoporphyrinogen oxidase
MTKTAFIVGGGIGGLTAGFRLQQAGWKIRILERESFVGGRMRTVRKDGFTIDVGAGILPASYKAVLKLLSDAKHSDLIDHLTGKIAIPRGQKMHMLDMSNLKLSLLKTSLISWKSKLKLLRVGYDIWRARNVLGFDTISGAGPFDTGSVDAYANLHLTQELLDYVIEPTLKALYLNDAKETSIIEFFWNMKNLSSNSSFCLKGGMDRLAVELAKKLPVEFNITVEQISQEGNSASLTMVDSEGRRSHEIADLVIVAADGKVVADLCRNILTQHQLGYLSNLRYSSSVNLHFGLRQDPGVEALIIEVPSTVDKHVSALVMDHLKGPGRAPAGKGLVSVFFQDEWGQRMLNASDAEIFADAIPRIDRIIPGFSALIEVKHIQRWPVAATITEPGICELLKTFEDDIKPGQRVIFASDLFAPSSVNTCVVQGERAALAAMALAS